MSKSIEIVEELLKLAGPEHKTVKDMMLWQRGYLTGLLAAIIKDDSITRLQITKRIKHYKNKD